MAAGDEALALVPALVLSDEYGSAPIRFGPRRADGSMRVGVGDAISTLRLDPVGETTFAAIADDRRIMVRIEAAGDTIAVWEIRGAFVFVAAPWLSTVARSQVRSGEVRAPMMGMILTVAVAPGDRIAAGETAAVLESMKMELRIVAEVAGTVTAVHCAPGQMVERNAVVVVVEPAT